MKACPACNSDRTPATHNGWIGVDLDGTLAKYDGWKGADHIGEPIPLMVQRVKDWLAEGKDVRIFTARISPQACRLNRVSPALVLHYIDRWCAEHIGRPLAVTCSKDLAMVELWDDRCVQVMPNTGRPITDFVNIPMRSDLPK